MYTQIGGADNETIAAATVLLKLANQLGAEAVQRVTIKVTWRDLMRRSRALSKMKSDDRTVADVMTVFVVNGWIAPETDYPNNRTWTLNPALKGHLQEDMQRQLDLHAAISAKIRG